MRFAKLLFAVFVFSMMSSSVVYGTEIEPEGTPLRKLQRGFLNVALSPIEISNELSKEMKHDTVPPSWLTGAGRGAVYMVGRALMGAYEIVTFPFPTPAGYKPILKPEFPWDHLPSSIEGKS